jgi:Outer membrane protein beta-barrel domain
MFRRFLIALFLVSLFAAGAIAQEQPKSAVSINFGATFTQRSGDQPSGNAVYTLSFERLFAPHSGVVLNYSNLQDQKFATPDGGVQSTANEATIGYMARFSRGKLSPFVVVGGGALIFSPTSNYVLSSGGTPSTQTRAALLYGGGADYNFTKNLAFRAQYRGFIFAAPNFHTVDLDNGLTAHTAQTSVGFVFRF